MEAQVIPSLTRWFTPDDLAVNHWACATPVNAWRRSPRASQARATTNCLGHADLEQPGLVADELDELLPRDAQSQAQPT
jgi:hypothetical protein